MINRLSVSTIWVKDLNEALRFYTEKLGFEIRADIRNGDYRWLTVGTQSQPDLDIHLEAVQPGAVMTQEQADQMMQLLDAGVLSSGPWKTDDCQKTYETLVANGVEFVQPPTDRAYGIIEAVFKDNSGNVMVLAQDKPRRNQ